MPNEEIKKPIIKEISISENQNESLDKSKNENIIEDKYTFKLENFDGPLDLLVTLIKEKNIDIFEVDLVDLATQYLQIIRHLEENDFDIASEYLVMAATLLQLKARSLLKDPTIEEEVKQEKKRLLEQIAEYEKFKEISLILKQQEEIRRNIYSKNPEDTTDFIKDVDDSILTGHANSSRLVVTLRKMFERTYAELIRNVTISTIAVSPEEQKKRVLELFKNRNEVPFEEIFNVPTTGHFVITLLAVLDLARQEILFMEQKNDEEIIRFTRGVGYER